MAVPFILPFYCQENIWPVQLLSPGFAGQEASSVGNVFQQQEDDHSDTSSFQYYCTTEEFLIYWIIYGLRILIEGTAMNSSMVLQVQY